jgi:hypothetical protein
MSRPRVASSSPPSITPQQARDLRARAWIFAFERFEHCKKKAATSPVSRPDDGTETKEDSADVSSLSD